MKITYYQLNEDITINTNFSREHVEYYIKSYLFRRQAYNKLNRYKERNNDENINYYIVVRKLTIF